MTVLDSDIWIAFFNTNDSQHAKARRLLHTLELQQEEVGVHEYVILEVVTVLRRIASPKQAAAFVRAIAASTALRVLYSDPETVRDVCAVVYGRQHPKLSYTDLVLLRLSLIHSVHTFDRVLKREITSRPKDRG